MSDEAMPSNAAVAEILDRLTRGERQAGDELLPLVYQELRGLAESQLRRSRPGHTLQPTALVHEAYLRLLGKGDPGWDGKHHFFGAAANAMRQIIVDYARRHVVLKRGMEHERAKASESVPFELSTSPENLIALDEAMDALDREHPRQGQVVLLRYFGGLGEEETAEVLGVSVRTVRRDWVLAKGHLAQVLAGTDDGSQPSSSPAPSTSSDAAVGGGSGSAGGDEGEA